MRETDPLKPGKASKIEKESNGKRKIGTEKRNEGQF